jgi:amidase
MTEALHRLGAVALQRAIAARHLSVAALTEALLARSAALEPRLRAWASLDPTAARRRAGALDLAGPAGPLGGLPLGVKDNIDTAGLPTAYGSAIYAGHVPAVDAACVALARAGGAWVLGKTACTAFANMTPAATRNPWNLRHTPGGSSSGSAVAVATGMVPLALGTQTAGSVIRPAAFCGIVGYKPSPRRVPRAGVKANSDTLDEVGVLARSVEDATLLAGVLDGRGMTAAATTAPPRLAHTLTSRADALAPAVVQALQEAARRLAAAGAPVQDASWPPSFDGLFEAQRTVQVFETARALAPEWQYRRRQLPRDLCALLRAGLGIPASDYAAALRTADDARMQLESLFGSADVLLTPAAPGAAPASLKATGDPLFNRPWQLLGCPCLTLPIGLDTEGLPLGLQLVARPGDDERLLAAAACAEGVLQSPDISRARCG